MATILPFHRPSGRDERPPFAHALRRGFAFVPKIDFVEVRNGTFVELYSGFGEPVSMYVDPVTGLTVVRWMDNCSDVYAAEISSGYVIYERPRKKAGCCR